MAVFIKPVVAVQHLLIVIIIVYKIIVIHLKELVPLIPWLMEVPAPVIVLLGL